MKLLEVEDLEIAYPARSPGRGPRRTLRAVNRVGFHISEGETLGLVGESGCGKSSLARALVLLERPSGGRIRFRGEDVRLMDRARRKRYRRQVQMIFQDPYGSLNPRLPVGESIAEGLRVQGMLSGREAVRSEVARLLDRVGLDASAAGRLPREFSGGQRQRIGIARALALRPDLVICDEPVSALDVSVQAQVANLLAELQKDSGLAYLFITHDLAVVEHMSHRVMVMYLGQVVEEGPAREVIGSPRHPYTRMLVASVPGRRGRDLPEQAPVRGEIPSPLDVPDGCPFHSRCPLAEDRCRTERPALEGSGRRTACHLAGSGG